MAPVAVGKRVSLMGLDFDALIEEQTVSAILAASQRRGGWVLTPNLEHLRAYQMTDEVQREFDSADLVVPDGMPLLWASRLKNEALPGRVAGSDLIWSLSRAAAQSGASVLFVGGAPGTAQQAAERLQLENPGLLMRGALCPLPGFERSRQRVDETAREAARLRPDIVFLGLPLIKQLVMARQLKRRLPRAWIIGVGVSFSFVSGDIRRAPTWAQHAGLEWVHRLAQEPRRLFRRYVVEGIPFAIHLLLYSTLAGALSELAWRPDRIPPGKRAAES